MDPLNAGDHNHDDLAIGIQDREALSPSLREGRSAQSRLRAGSYLMKRLGGAGRPYQRGPCFTVSAGQRVLVKAMVSKHRGRNGSDHKGLLAKHVRYLAREALHLQNTETEFYNQEGIIDGDQHKEMITKWEDDRHHFRIIISPEHGDKIKDFQAYIVGLMDDVAIECREPHLSYIAINHFDTDQPHAHVLIRGKRANGRDLTLPKAFISHGLRQRAEARAYDLLGDQSRGEAELGLRRRMTADYWTDIDAKLSRLASLNNGLIAPHLIARPDEFGSITRGRIAHLRGLGLIDYEGALGVRIVADLKDRLALMQKQKDLIRSHLDQIRLEGFKSHQVSGINQQERLSLTSHVKQIPSPTKDTDIGR